MGMLITEAPQVPLTAIDAKCCLRSRVVYPSGTVLSS